MIDYRELLKKYMEHTFNCCSGSFDSIRFDVGTDDSLTEEQQRAIIDMMDQVEDE